MNWVGPTARSCTGSPSSRPPSVSLISAVRTPSSAIPMIGGVDVPSVCSTDPENWPWLDSTRPIAATSDQLRWQPAGLAAAARRYAASAVAGMPSAASAEAVCAGLGAADDVDREAADVEVVEVEVADPWSVVVAAGASPDAEPVGAGAPASSADGAEGRGGAAPSAWGAATST